MEKNDDKSWEAGLGLFISIIENADASDVIELISGVKPPDEIKDADKKE